MPIINYVYVGEDIMSYNFIAGWTCGSIYS